MTNSGVPWVPSGLVRLPHPQRQDTGLRNLPLHGYALNQIWRQVVTLACELIARTGVAPL
jgi:hypothetical protein